MMMMMILVVVEQESVFVNQGYDGNPADVMMMRINCWRFEICLPVIYDPIEFSPDGQITPKLFYSLNSTNIYILSGKRMLNGSISMEVRFNTFPLS
mmetsp:Transcript_5440/g.6004  ORF Transcript_5440/g.6004 Transcript_5440/m.6004 type:complete len:96 (+) Transcript_5440:172-459(+)